jgi:hypothetical protein
VCTLGARKLAANRFKGVATDVLIPSAVLILAMLLTVRFSGQHPDSLYRNTVFICFFEILLLSCLWYRALGLLPARSKPLAIYCLAAYVSYTTLSAALVHANTNRPGWYGRDSGNHIASYVDFAVGRISVEQALLRGDGLWLPALKAKQLVGYETKILCLTRPAQSATYFFPGSGVIIEGARSFDAQWHVIAFEDKERAERTLKNQNINYFLVNCEQPFFGAIPFNPLFAADEIGKRFDAVAQWNDSYLITWRHEGRSPLSQNFIRSWKRKMAEAESGSTLPLRKGSDAIMFGLYRNMKVIYEYNKGRDFPIRRPPNLAHVQGWQ